MATSKKAPKAPQYTKDQVDRAFRVAERIFAGPYVESLMTDPKAMERVALRSLQFVGIFDSVAVVAS